MKTKWKQFAQRRKINLEMFRTMSYEGYVAWCNFRKVEPVSKDSYESVQNMLTKELAKEQPPALEVTTISTHEFNESQLKKLRKPALLALCKENNLSIEKTATKKQIIDQLLQLNNS